MELNSSLFYRATAYLTIREKIDQKKFREKKSVKIIGFVYNNKDNFYIKSIVNDYRNGKNHDVEIDVENGSMIKKNCDCAYGYYSTCEHVVATLIAAEELKVLPKNPDFEKEVKEKEFKIFSKIIDMVYNEEMKKIDNNKKTESSEKVRLEPKLVFSKYGDEIRLEFKVGNKHMYKIKSLSEFYDNVNKSKYFKYGEKLKFIHNKENFEEVSKELLDYVLRYSQIIKYANEAAQKSMSYSNKIMNTSAIELEGKAIDEFFEMNKEKEIECQDRIVILEEADPPLDFKLEKVTDEKYMINQVENEDIIIIYGEKATYLYTKLVIYKCSKEYEETILRLYNILKNNNLEHVAISKEQIPKLFSVVLPNTEEAVEFKNIKEEEIAKYKPRKLDAKVFLDFDQDLNLTLDAKFCYGDNEFNPLDEKKEYSFPRNTIEEAKILNVFLNSKFMKDKKKKIFVMQGDEEIYEFLSNDIEYYMQKYEVMVTDNFKTKQIRQPKMGTVGVRVENNLLSLNLNEMDIDLEELETVMDKYKLKKKFHKLKNGTFINLEENKEIEFLDKIVDGMDIDYNQIQKGQINLPVQRTLYLNQLLKQLKGTEVVKNRKYKEIVKGFDKELLEDDLKVPATLDKVLRLYQKTGYKWLSVLDKYKFGGVLADDMGLRKNCTNIIYNKTIC